MQDKILACIVAYPDRFMKYAGVLHSAFFSGTQRTAAARAIIAYWNKFNRFPSWEILGDVVYDSIARTAEQKEEDSIIAYIRRLEEMDTADVDYVAESVISWARKRACYNALDKAINAFHDGNVPDEVMGEAIKKFEDALKIGQDVSDLGYIIHPDYPDISAVLDKLTQRDYGIPTGYPLLDEIWPFGWGPGWLISILAPPKRFKTTFCINLAMNMVNGSSAPVFYYPCEITSELAILRSACHLTQLGSDEFYRNPGAFREQVLSKMGFFRGPLVVKGFPAKAATVGGDIRNHAKMVRHQLGIVPKAIIIDYADTVKALNVDKRTSEHRASGEVYVEARALGSEMQCPVIIPDRCTKETVGRKVPSMKSFQGSFEKAGIVDVAIGLCGSDEEIMSDIMRYFVFLNRHGAAMQYFKGGIQPQQMRMTIEEAIPYKPEDDDFDDDAMRRGRRQRQRKGREVPEDLLD